MSRQAKPGPEAPEGPADFLARWSRRKIEAREAAARPDVPDAAAAASQETAADMPQAHCPEPELTDADMPPLETLTGDSDFAPFMSPGVSDGLRQKALRILFSQPGCNITDGLNDYDDDYTQFAGMGNLVTHEMKRMLQRELEAEQRRQQQPAERAQEPGVADAGVPPEPGPEQAQSAAAGQLDKDAEDAADKG